MSKSLYEEAIAEAKQLREVAEQNAKNAIVEAVTPRIRKFIEDQLVREDTSDIDGDFLSDVISEVSENEEDEEVVLDESALSSLLRLVDASQESEGTVQEAIKDALGESFESLSNKDRTKILEIARNLRNNADNLNTGVIDIDMTETIQEKSQMSDETLYEIDLDELSQAFKSALSEQDEDQKEEDAAEAYMRGSEKDSVDELDLDSDVDEMLEEIALRVELGEVELDSDDLSVMIEPDEEGEEVEGELDDELDMELDLDAEAADDEEALDEVFEIDPAMLRKEIRNMRSALSEGEAKAMAHHFGGGTAGKDALDFKDTDLNVLSENRHLRKALRTESRKNRALSGKIAEYRGAVGSLREQLTEMNLFNAKLLYVNKLLQSHSVSPKKRRSIIESLDKAANLREVKLLYRSLTRSLEGETGGNLSESRRRTMGSSSRATSRASVDTSTPSGELDRWAKLAGLK